MNRFACVALLLLPVLRLLAQIPIAPTGVGGTPVERIGIEQGLSQGFVTCLLQDREGFIWAGTLNGLNRFDGYRFKIFRHDPFDETSLSNNFINSLTDADDYLLVGTVGGGLNLFHKKTQRFFRLPFAPTREKWQQNRQDPAGRNLTTSTIFFADLNAGGNLWVGSSWYSSNAWVSKITLPPRFLERLPHDTSLLSGIQIKDFEQFDTRQIAWSSDKKRLWLLDASRVHVIDAATEAVSEIELPVNGKSNAMQYLFEDEQGVLWLKQAGYLSFLQNGRWTTMPYERGVSQIFTAGKSDELWFIEHPNNVSVFSRSHLMRQHNASKPLRVLPVNHRRGFGMPDRSGNVWLLTQAEGLMKITPRAAHFRHFFPAQSVLANPAMLPNGNVFFDTNQGRLAFTDENEQKYAPILRRAVSESGIFASRSAFDQAGNCWLLGSKRYEGTVILLKIELETGRYERFVFSQKIANSAALAVDGQGHVWFGAGGFLVHFDPKTKSHAAFDYRQLGLGDEPVMCLAQTAGGDWWLGTGKGLVRAKPKSGGDGFDFELLQTNPKDRNSLSGNNIACLFSDPAATPPTPKGERAQGEVLWIGTKGGGLNRLDLATGKFSHLTSARGGLPDDVIYGILAEEGERSERGGASKLWLSTNRGLVRYDPASGELKNFRQADGLQSDEFNTWAYGRGRNGELLFGGVNGLNVFHPGELADNPVKPNVLLTGLKINNVEISTGDSTGILTDGIEFAKRIVLPYSKNNLTLEFAALEFSATSKNRFRYHLEGAENPGAHESTEPFASYLNLAPGSYTFIVYGSNNDGVFSEQPARLEIVVLPPWWRSRLAWIVYILAAAALVFWFIRYRVNRLRLKNELEMEHRESLRVKALDKLKSDFYTNISHEFRTPLTVIMGMAERAEQHFRDGAGSKLYQATELIKRNGQSLLRLVNQMLDLSKLESGALRVNLEQGDVVTYVKYVLESFHSFALAKNIRLHFLTDEETVYMDYDREKLLSILYNLLSNAVKFTPPGGNIYVDLRLRQPENGTEETLQIRVKDTGEGIPDAHLPYIFDRFFQVRSAVSTESANSTASPAGSGIGLALVKELVQMMDGEITVKSKPGVGAEFNISLPVRRRMPVETPVWQVERVVPPNLQAASDQAFSPVPETLAAETDLPLLLIVEDNLDVAQYVASCVETTYSVVFAADGEEGIGRALELVPDLVLSDVMMPKKDGYQLCDTLKNDERTSHVPIVLLTAKVDAASRIEGLRRGADAYLPKPFEVQELLVTLKNLIDLRRNLHAHFASAEPLPQQKEDLDLEIEDAFLKKIRELLEANMEDGNFGIPQLSRKLGYSQTHVFRKIKALTGKSTSLYLRSLRLQKALDLLKETRLSISEIAYQTGFSDPAYFSRCFSEEFGEAPNVVRK